MEFFKSNNWKVKNKRHSWIRSDGALHPPSWNHPEVSQRLLSLCRGGTESPGMSHCCRSPRPCSAKGSKCGSLKRKKIRELPKLLSKRSRITAQSPSFRLLVNEVIKWCVILHPFSNCRIMPGLLKRSEELPFKTTILRDPRTVQPNLLKVYKLPTKQISLDFLTANPGNLEGPWQSWLLFSFSTGKSLCKKKKKPVVIPQ